MSVRIQVQFDGNPHRKPWGMSVNRVPVAGDIIEFRDVGMVFRVDEVRFYAAQYSDMVLPEHPLVSCTVLKGDG